MLIVCPSCATAYRIELPTLGDNGRSVRCARCREVWFASAASAVPESHEAPAQAVSQARAEASARPAPPGEVSDDAGDLGLADWSSADLAGDAPASEATESVTVTDGPSLVPSLEQSDAAAGPDGTIIAAQGEDIETIAARRERVTHRTRKGSRLKWGLPGLPAVILILIAALAALINWRTTVVRVVPQTASLFAIMGLPVNLRGLAFEGVKSFGEFHDGMAVLVLEGAIVNVTKQPVEVPRLRLAVRNGAGLEVYAWTALPERSVIAPGDKLPFRTRLASPPTDGREAIVRFFNRRDAIAGVR